MNCKRCEDRGKTWQGGDPVCAFPKGEFQPDNWMCATMNALRDLVEDKEVYADDQKAALIPYGYSFVLLGWYKSRGRTEFAGLLKEREIKPLSLADAEAVLDSEESRRERKV